MYIYEFMSEFVYNVYNMCVQQAFSHHRHFFLLFYHIILYCLVAPITLCSYLVFFRQKVREKLYSHQFSKSLLFVHRSSREETYKGYISCKNLQTKTKPHQAFKTCNGNDNNNKKAIRICMPACIFMETHQDCFCLREFSLSQRCKAQSR